jgi:hypothetical protein
MTRMTNDELIAVLRALERKGMIESRIFADGEVRWRITSKGIAVLVLHHSPARSVLGRRTARPEHIAATRRSSSASPVCNLRAIQLAVNETRLRVTAVPICGRLKSMLADGIL